MASYWLMKSEPGVYSIDDLVRDGRTTWEGVRNYQARNFMRDVMTIGDLALFYHSSAEPPGVAGICRVASKAYPDPTQFDKKHPWHDPESKKDDPRWLLVDVEIVEKLPTFVALEQLRSDRALAGMLVLRRAQRLSVMPVEKKHFERVLALGGAKTRAR